MTFMGARFGANKWSVPDPEGAREPWLPGPQTHDRLKKSCESCCRRDSVFRRWQ